jgi:hypothetical protein
MCCLNKLRTLPWCLATVGNLKISGYSQAGQARSGSVVSMYRTGGGAAAGKKGGGRDSSRDKSRDQSSRDNSRTKSNRRRPSSAESGHASGDEDDCSTASSELNDAERGEDDEKEAAPVIVSKAGTAANELRDRVMLEVISSVMPDIGAYDMDGMVQSKKKTSNGLLTRVAKAIGLKNMDLHECVLSGSTIHLHRAIERIQLDPNSNPSFINQYDEQGQTPLSMAVKTSSESMVTTLLRNQALVDIGDEYSGRTPLMFSVLNGTVEITNLLLQHGAAVDLADFKCVTPLMLAGSRNDEMHCQMLCAVTADFDLQDDNGWTPMHYAANGNAPKALAILLGEGANRNLKDNNKRKPLDIAKYKKYMDCIAELSIVKDLF